MPSPERSRLPAALALVAIVLAAFGLRLHGLGFGLPHMTYRDGMVLYTQTKALRTDSEELRRDQFFGYYPQVTARVAALLPDETMTSVPVEPLDLDGHLAWASRTWTTLRLASVLLSLFAVVGAYAIARRFLGRGGSLIAAWFVATSLLHFSFSQQEKPHGPISGTVALALVAALALREKPDRLRMFLAVLAASLALCTLQSGVFVFGSLAAVWIMWWRQKPRPVARLAAAPIALLVVGAACVRFFFPFYFGAPLGDAGVDKKAAIDLAGHPLFIESFNFSGTKVVLSTLSSYDPSLLVFGVIGLIAFALRRRPDPDRRASLIVVCSFALPFLLVLCAYDSGVTFERFLMPLIPCIAVLAAYGVTRIGELLPASLRTSPAQMTLACLALAPATAVTWQMGAVRAAPDSWTQMATYVRANVEPDEWIYTMPLIDLPLFKDPDAAARSGREGELTYWSRYLDSLPEEKKLGPRFRLVLPKPAAATEREYGDDPIGFLERSGADYVIVQAAAETHAFAPLSKLRKALRERGDKPVFRVTPIGDQSTGRGQFALRYSQSLTAKPLALRVFEANCYGNTLEIYSLRAE